MQIRRSRSYFQQLDAEPRSAGNPSAIFPGGPPPSYRSSTNADDSITFSSTESSTVAATAKSTKRRNSWTNLIENNENLCKNDLSYYTEPLCISTATTTTTNNANIVMPACITWTEGIYQTCQSLEKYNLNGRYAKHFTPFYILNSAGDPIAISKLELTNSLCKLNGGGEFSAGFTKRDRMNELKQCFQNPKNKSYAFILFLLIITCCTLASILFFHKELFPQQESRKFSWIPPLIFRNQQRNSTVIKMYHNGHQVRFEILGNPPIKNNYIAIYDFRVRRIAIIDSTLKNNGKNLICFMMNMNISTMPDRYALEIGAQNAFKRTEQIHGWEEAWNFLPTSYFGNSSTLFDPPIFECDGARWILLNYTKSDQKGQKCSDCYDFCLPELGIERDYLRAETFLNIIRRNCFYLFVPEWRSFAAAYSGKQNQNNFEQFYYQGLGRTNNGNNSGNYGNHFNEIQNVIDGIAHPITSDQYRNFESKWISLQKIPQQISNPTNQAMDQMSSNIASNAQNSPSNAAQSIFENRNYQQQNAEDSYTGNMPSTIHSNFNLNNKNNDFNNDQIRNGFENAKSDLSNNNDRMKPLLLMPPPSYPIQVKQSLDHANSHTYQNFGGGSVRQQNAAFENINNIGQFALPTKYNGQPNSLSGQLSSGQMSDGLSNRMNIDSKDSQSKSIYDQSIMNISSYGESISKQSNYYTSQPGIDIYMQQAAANPRRNDQDNGSGIQQSANDQGWITVGKIALPGKKKSRTPTRPTYLSSL